MEMKHIKTQQELNEASENLNISDVSDSDLLLKLNSILSHTKISFEKASNYTYHVKIHCNEGGLHKWDILGCGDTLINAIKDAIFIYDNRYDKHKMYNKEWQFKKIDARKQ